MNACMGVTRLQFLVTNRGSWRTARSMDLRNRLICLTLSGIAVLCLTLATPSRAYGYVDPGSGSFVYQAVYAAFLGGTFYFRRLLDRVFRRNK